MLVLKQNIILGPKASLGWNAEINLNMLKKPQIIEKRKVKVYLRWLITRILLFKSYLFSTSYSSFVHIWRPLPIILASKTSPALTLGRASHGQTGKVVIDLGCLVITWQLKIQQVSTFIKLLMLPQDFIMSEILRCLEFYFIFIPISV